MRVTDERKGKYKMKTKTNIKTLSDFVAETNEQKKILIMSGRRSGKTGMQTVSLINSLPIPQSEKNRLIKIYFDEFRIMTQENTIREI